MAEKTFPLGVTFVDVYCIDGTTYREDYDPKNRRAAHEWAAETASCADVAKTVYHHRDTSETFLNGAHS